jgi:hypothetical protein
VRPVILLFVMQAISQELGRFISDARPRLAEITESRATEKPYPEKWSLKEILGHLIDSAANNHQRIVRMQEKKSIGMFTYSQQHWVSSQRYQSRPWEEIVRLWYDFNAHLAHVIACVDPQTLGNTCDVGHTQPVTLEFVIADYLRHVQHHVGQILSGADPRQRTVWTHRFP